MGATPVGCRKDHFETVEVSLMDDHRGNKGQYNCGFKELEGGKIVEK